MQLKIKDIVIEIDECDTSLVNSHRWYVADGQYIVTNIGGTTTTLSRILFPDLYGRVQHLNGNHLDFRRCNLKIVTISESLHLRLSQSNNKSGVIGIFYRQDKDRWIASIQRDGKRVQKSFRTKEAAIEWRQQQ